MRYVDHWDTVVVTAVRDLTPQVREITLETPWTAAHAPGAHIDVEVPIDGRPDTRSYSLVGEGAGAPRRIAVKAEPSSRGGSRYMWSLQPGARLKVTPPSNSFELSLEPAPYLLVAGGIGVTPIVGMAGVLARRGADVAMLYAGRSRGEMAYLGELASALGDRLKVFADDEAGGPPDLAAAFAALAADAQAYVCGPAPMLDAARAAWAAAGRPAARLRFETFGSSGAHPNAAFTVRAPGLGVEVEVPPTRSMLDALLDAGVEVLADCRRGECGLCAVDVVAADGVIDHRDVFLSEGQRQEGRKICACVSRVAGGVITIEAPWRGDVSITPSKVFG
ncbi:MULTISPECIES: PDR/VanB family oxidoreductase [unclassified Phenylobacterium]|uniref:PDR/VanB family oxidoreductase n=1 Tax=unclassified Phenylobacterium TaxID=2640670 RepID=UPI00083B8421|nr:MULTISPECIES: PDR/VanB family oxidoreductase [unclassified Phenylobacterium]